MEGQKEPQRFESTPPPQEKQGKEDKDRDGKQASYVWQTDKGQVSGRASKDAEVEVGPGWRWAGQGLGHFTLLQEMLVNTGLPLQSIRALDHMSSSERDQAIGPP